MKIIVIPRSNDWYWCVTLGGDCIGAGSESSREKAQSEADACCRRVRLAAYRE